MRMQTLYSPRIAAMIAIAAPALMLAACDTSIASQRDSIVSSCIATAGTPANISAAAIATYCNCSADKMIEQNMTPADALDQEKLRQVAVSCAGELAKGATAIGGATGAPTQ